LFQSYDRGLVPRFSEVPVVDERKNVGGTVSETKGVVKEPRRPITEFGLWSSRSPKKGGGTATHVSEAMRTTCGDGLPACLISRGIFSRPPEKKQYNFLEGSVRRIIS